MRNTLAKMPILKVVIPFIIGIIAYSIISIPLYISISGAIIFFCLHLIISHKASPFIKLSQSYIINFPLIATFLCIGLIISDLKTPRELSPQPSSSSYATAIIENIQHNDVSCSIRLQMVQYTDSLGVITPSNAKMTAWVEGNNYNLTEGDIICFKFSPEPIKNNGNPEEFDYTNYMRHNGYIYHNFIHKNNYEIIGHKSSIFSYAKSIQNQLIDLLLSSSLTPNTKYFFITILLGEDSFLDSDTRSVFSKAGISHILALSGLHICIIAFIINLILMPLDYIFGKNLRHITTLISIIIFALISGLSISVIRATIMMAFVIIAHLLYRKNSSLNALFAAALIITLINPFSIFDIGFQLSFVSVFLIIVVSNHINIVPSKNKLLHYTYSILSTSIIAYIGTMFISAYYFNTMSFISILTNCIIIPILPIVICIGLFYLISLALGFDISILSQTLNTINRIITDISHLGDSFYINTYISPILLIFILLAIIVTILFIVHKQKSIYIHCLILFVISSFIIKIVENHKNQISSGYVIFHDFKSTPIIEINGNNATLITLNENLNINDFKQKHKQFLAKHNIDNINHHFLSSDTHTTLGNNTIAIITENNLTKVSRTPKINVDILLITKGYYGSIEDVLRNYTPKIIVLSSNIYYKREQLLVNQCNELNIPNYSISASGAFCAY